MPRKKLENGLRPAFEEMWIYPFTVLGVFCAPIVAAATLNRPIKFEFDWTAFVIALVITAALVIVTELRGTKEQKQKRNIRLSRYATAFLLGLFWRLIVPLIEQAVVRMFSGTVGG